MAVVVEVRAHVVVEDLVVHGSCIDADPICRVADGCAVAGDMVRLEQVRVGTQQKDPAAPVVLDIVRPHDDLLCWPATLEHITAERDSVGEVVGHVVVRDLEAGLRIGLDPVIVVEDTIVIDLARARRRLVEDDPRAERHRPMIPADDVLLNRPCRFAEDDDAVRRGSERNERGLRLVVRDRVAPHVHERSGVHRLNAVLLVPVDDVVVDARAGGRSERRSEVRKPLANRHGVTLLAAPQQWVAVSDESDVVVVDPPVERVFESHALVAIGGAATRVERAADCEPADDHAVGAVDVNELVVR